MTGPEHYAEGERLLALASGQGTPHEVYAEAAVDGLRGPEECLQEARAHFAAAQVAATVEGTASRGPGDVAQDWREVLGIAAGNADLPPL